MKQLWSKNMWDPAEVASYANTWPLVMVMVVVETTVPANLSNLHSEGWWWYWSRRLLLKVLTALCASSNLYSYSPLLVSRGVTVAWVIVSALTHISIIVATQVGICLMLICILIYVMLIHKVFSSFATEFTDGCRRGFSIVVDDYIVFFPFCFCVLIHSPVLLSMSV